MAGVRDTRSSAHPAEPSAARSESTSELPVAQPLPWPPEFDGPVPRQVVVLGSTGSIGRSTLDVIRSSAGRLSTFALSAHTRIEMALAQAAEFSPRYVVATCPESARRSLAHPPMSSLAGSPTASPPHLPVAQSLGSSATTAPTAGSGPAWEVRIGAEALAEIVSHPEVSVVVAGIVGSAGLASTMAALRAGKTVALANKETLVMAGHLVTKLTEQFGGQLLPVDSEHSAVFQAMSAGGRQEVKQILLTASGGPFLRWSAAQMEQATVAQALAHPTWQMGPKISVDSATMMNKALEIIEARWLFNLEPSQIQVVVHPQSIVHSLVEFQDGSVIAQLSSPDMRLPIQYALSYPARWPVVAERLDWSRAMQLNFEPPDLERFPALRLGYEVAAAGGTAGAVLNAANEAAVAEFLAGRIPFGKIVPVCETVLKHHTFDPNSTLDELVALDLWARQEVLRWISRS